jgi:hypothetical protein
VQALMGLCHALLGNYRTAIGLYRRALRASPRNPWYHHNVGHLLDVALDEPSRALPHLRSAHDFEPLEDEITASFAHCLARVGKVDEARTFAVNAVRAAPRNRDHRALLAWITRGAPAGESPHAGSSSPLSRHAGGGPWKRGRLPELDELGVGLRDAELVGLPAAPPTRSGSRTARPASSPRVRAAPARASSRGPEPASSRAASAPPRSGDEGADQGAFDADVRASWRAVDVLLERAMTVAGCPPRQRTIARSLWHDFFVVHHPRVTRPGLFAAAVEYVLRTHQRESSVTQADIARRYEVSASALSQRAALIREVLSLRPSDPRYQR